MVYWSNPRYLSYVIVVVIACQTVYLIMTSICLQLMENVVARMMSPVQKHMIREANPSKIPVAVAETAHPV